MEKNVLIDTNLYLDDANIIYKLSNSYDKVLIPLMVLKELDDKKYNECHEIYKKTCDQKGIITSTKEIMNMLLWRFKLFLFIKEQQSKNKTDDEIKNNIKNTAKPIL